MKPSSHRNSCRRPDLRVVLACLILPSAALHASEPGWWSQVKDSGQVQNDYAAANVGQLKHMATEAASAMDACGYGAGDAIHALVAAWHGDTASNNYVALTAGQLKFVAKAFYDRLGTLGALPAGQYPWSPGGNDYSVVNIGQLKNVFAFSLP